MDWYLVVIPVAFFAILFFWRKSGLANEEQARGWLREGARVIDVRSPEEFAQRRLPGAMNIPLNGIREQIGSVAPRKDEILLLHCVAGGRSAMGVRALKQLGYTAVHNLGSYSRAERILSSHNAPSPLPPSRTE